ncbi:hypothetical protein AB0D97_21100 [Streptomyces roseus]|uniref:hypothetical protein n=1 Tax=Streptomyces roseus TaxID=66430 RepID=UPI003406FBEF
MLKASRRGIAVAAATSALVCTMGTATPASATAYTSYVSDNCDFMNCTEGDLFINYHSVNDGQMMATGSYAKFYGNIYDYAGETRSIDGGRNTMRYVYVFYGSQGDGSGELVKNNAGSGMNCSSVDKYRVYFNSGYQGTSQEIPHYYGCTRDTNLIATLKNNNASQHFG